VTGFLAVGEAEPGVAEFSEVAADEDDLLPGVLRDEVDDGLVFGKAFGPELRHGAKDEDFVVEGGGGARGRSVGGGCGAGGCGAGGCGGADRNPREIFDGGAHAGGVGIISIQNDMKSVLFDEL